VCNVVGLLVGRVQAVQRSASVPRPPSQRGPQVSDPQRDDPLFAPPGWLPFFGPSLRGQRGLACD
jgi:hypothetical protein